ncbi:MAG: ABC transporter permease [Chitinivibrionales bacterium]|nr:ABC transporter permease [Chitinivibrionales bacterium]
MKSFLLAIYTGVIMAIKEMGVHKLRSLLSMLGVFLGVGALVAILTLIGGIDAFLHERLGVWLGSVWIAEHWDPTPDQKIAFSRSPGHHLADGDSLKLSTANVSRVYRQITRNNMTVHTLAGNEYRVLVKGTLPETFVDEQEFIKIRRGRWLNDDDYAFGRRNCLISWELADKIQEMLGRAHRDQAEITRSSVIIRNVAYSVVGVFERKDTTFNGVGQLTRSVVMPLRTLEQNISGFNPNPQGLLISVADPESMSVQTSRLAHVFAGLHRGVEDFEFHPFDWVENVTTMFNNVSLLMGIISLISLLSGGLGIMNVMLSSISERIKEIGVRKALGARDTQIFVQFIAETTTLCCVGGGLGLVPGMLPLMFKEAIARSSNGAIVPTVQPIHIVLVLLLIIAMGVAFGMYPAVKAARMDPVDALRYE